MNNNPLWDILGMINGMIGAFGCGTTGCALIALVVAVGCGFLASLLPAGWMLYQGADPIGALKLGLSVDPGNFVAGVIVMLPYLVFVIFVSLLAFAIIDMTK